MEEKKQLDYSRLHKLAEKFEEFLDILPDGKNMGEDADFELIIFAHDIKNKVSGVYSLFNNKDERESLVQCIDNCISGALKGRDVHPDEWEIFNGLAEYFVRIFIMYPDLYEAFKKEVDQTIKNELL